MDKFKSKFWVILTLAVGIVTAVLVYIYLTGLQQKSLDQVNVVVAARKIPQNARITADAVKIVQVPADYAHPEAMDSVEGVVGSFSTAEIWPDEVLLPGKLASAETGNELPYRIPKGTRAVTVSVTPESAVANLIKPGHRVDVLISYKIDREDKQVTESFTMLQNIKVLAVGSEMDKKDGVQAGENITLAVIPQDAQKVMLAENTGKIKLALRLPEDNQKIPSKPLDLKKMLTGY